MVSSLELQHGGLTPQQMNQKRETPLTNNNIRSIVETDDRQGIRMPHIMPVEVQKVEYNWFVYLFSFFFFFIPLTNAEKQRLERLTLT